MAVGGDRGGVKEEQEKKKTNPCKPKECGANGFAKLCRKVSDPAMDGSVLHVQTSLEDSARVRRSV